MAGWCSIGLGDPCDPHPTYTFLNNKSVGCFENWVAEENDRRVCRGKPNYIRRIDMAVLIEMPVVIYQTFLGRCPSLSREYELLGKSIGCRTPVYVRFGNVVECLCELDDAELLLTRAKISYPLASSYIEKGIRRAQKPFDASQIEYRKTAVQLRDHPQMNFAGYANWPPIWVSGAGSKTYKKKPLFVNSSG